ncbi:unnamed protein product, partial [Ectocarpus sp. 12 AP-2014]
DGARGGGSERGCGCAVGAGHDPPAAAGRCDGFRRGAGVACPAAAAAPGRASTAFGPCRLPRPPGTVGFGGDWNSRRAGSEG